MVSVEDRLWQGVDASGDCWEWTRGKTAAGYGRIGNQYTHRLVWEFLVGPIPDGLEMDHLCRNVGCVNPDHLEPVTHAENMRRGHGNNAFRNATHCKRGHPFDEANTYRFTTSKGKPGRACRRCRTEYMRQRRADGLA